MFCIFILRNIFQIVYVRFGKVAHITFCIVALMTNLVISTTLLLAGKSAIEVRAVDVRLFVFCLLSFIIYFFFVPEGRA